MTKTPVFAEPLLWTQLRTPCSATAFSDADTEGMVAIVLRGSVSVITLVDVLWWR